MDGGGLHSIVQAHGIPRSWAAGAPSDVPPEYSGWKVECTVHSTSQPEYSGESKFNMGVLAPKGGIKSGTVLRETIQGENLVVLRADAPASDPDSFVLHNLKESTIQCAQTFGITID